jgi:hypothetical protein
MSKRTDKYQLGYFEQDDFTSPQLEMQRWESIDAQLNALFVIIGNGIQTGWGFVQTEGLNLTIAPGSGHVAFVAVESVESFVLRNLLPNTRQYIYAEIQEDSYWTKSVNFAAYTTFHESDDTSLYLGYVDTDDDSVTLLNTDDRQFLGFQNIINEAVAGHRHIGGVGNPSPVDLGSEVQGVLNQSNLPDLDTSVIRTGEIDPDRLPKINHITGLTDQGTLTHAQLDAFVETLNIADNQLMGEVSTINLLQLILALKHAYPDIDEFLVNEIAFIPGISPDDYVDMTNTTAEVDYRTASEGGEHTISMSPVAGTTTYTRVWDTEDDFEGGTDSNVFIDGDSVCLATTSNELSLEEFEDIDNWTVITEDLSSAPSSLILDPTESISGSTSGKLSITNQETEMAMVIRRDFNAQDWSPYNTITFYLLTEDVEHGDWQFFLSDSVAGVQNSYTLALERNTPTINVDTLLNGWQEVTVDITGFTRTSINQIGFFTSTQTGWDTSKPFDLNIDNIFLSTGNVYEDDGYVRVIFGSDLLVNFWRLRWDAVIPTDSESVGVVFKTRTRVANTELGLSTASWSDYQTVSPADIDLPIDTLYKYIEVESFFETSVNKNRTACLKKLYLDFNVSDTDAEFEFDSQDDWETGNLFNIDTTTDPGSIQVADIDDIGTYYFGTDGSAGQLSDSFGVNFSITGSVLPLTTYQTLNDLTPSFGYIAGVARGDKGSLWLADTDNDRVVKVDQFGNLIVGYYGSFLTDPEDPYGTEENGPGSNTGVSAVTVEETTPTEINVLHSLYNQLEGVLYIVFDSDLENVYDVSTNLDLNKMYLKLNAHKFSLNDSTVELLGVPEEKYTLWNSISDVSSESTEFIGQFKFDSHVLKISMNGADKTFLNNLVDEEVPAIGIGAPYQNFQTTESTIDIKFSLRDCVLGTEEGECGISVSVDGGASIIIYESTYSITGLTTGTHEVEAQLVDSDDVALTNDESLVELQFTRLSGYTNPYLKIFAPLPNQTYSNNPVTVEFESENFPVVPSGQHIKYQIDSEPAIDYYSTEPIKLGDVDPGKHTIRLFVVDLDGNELSFEYGDISVDFIVGLNPNAVLKLYIDRGAIYDKTKTAPVVTSRTNTDVGNVYFRNIFAPIDLQLIPDDTSGLAGSGISSIIAKLRSKSWLDGLSDQDAITEITVRAENIARAGSGEELLATNSAFDGVETNQLLFGTKYLDGHSVVQLNESGSTVFSNNAARFAEDKTRAKSILGSVEKIGSAELLIGDSVNKRAIITFTDLTTQVPTIEWQYDSDRFVPDFHIVPQEQRVIDIFDDSISESNIFVRQGTTVVWRNSSASPVTIYSGTTTAEIFAQDPDLTLYGDVFTSPVLDPGETYAFEFIDDGEFDWFVYPDILTGQINVTRQRLSSRDLYYILESDGLESPFTSRLIKVDSWGNILWSFGEGYLVQPRDVRPLLDGDILLST